MLSKLEREVYDAAMEQWRYSKASNWRFHKRVRLANELADACYVADKVQKELEEACAVYAKAQKKVKK